MEPRLLIGRCELDLHVENCHSLKDKRRVISSLKEKMRNHFNVAVCEFGDLALWQRAQLGITTCSNDRNVVESTIKAVLDYLNKIHAITLINSKLEII